MRESWPRCRRIAALRPRRPGGRVLYLRRDRNEKRGFRGRHSRDARPARLGMTCPAKTTNPRTDSLSSSRPSADARLDSALRAASGTRSRGIRCRGGRGRPPARAFVPAVGFGQREAPLAALSTNRARGTKTITLDGIGPLLHPGRGLAFPKPLDGWWWPVREHEFGGQDRNLLLGYGRPHSPRRWPWT